MRRLAFAAFFTVVPAAAVAQIDCGEPGSRWFADVHPTGAGEGSQIVIPIDSRLNLEVREEEIGFSIRVRDRKTGKNLFGTPPHGVEPYILSPWEVRSRRSGVVFSTIERGNIIPLGGVLIVDARDLYSSEEDPETHRQNEVFVKGVLHLCLKRSEH